MSHELHSNNHNGDHLHNADGHIYRRREEEDMSRLIDADALEKAISESGKDFIFGDVLEHMTVEEAQKVIAYAKEHCNQMLIAVPFLWEQGAIRGNPNEVHIQPDLTPELFNERYPGFKPIFMSAKYAYYVRDDV